MCLEKLQGEIKYKFVGLYTRLSNSRIVEIIIQK